MRLLNVFRKKRPLWYYEPGKPPKYGGKGPGKHYDTEEEAMDAFCVDLVKEMLATCERIENDS